MSTTFPFPSSSELTRDDNDPVSALLAEISVNLKELN